MSGTFPTSPRPDRVTITSIAPTLVSIAHSLKRQVRSRGGHRWLLSLEYRELRRDEYAPLWAFLVAQRGQYETFTIVPAGHETPRGALGGTPLAAGGTAAGLRSVPIDGLSTSVTGWGKAGDFVKFDGHAKVYMLTADVASNGAGEATLAIEPALSAAVADNEPVSLTSVPFTVALSRDDAPLPFRGGLRADLSVELVEAP